ncbi:MAG: aconitase X swivel domain-containing protein [Desulfatiglandales bacterium]
MTPGYGEGKALISKKPFMFAHGVEPRTGEIIDIRSDLLGENIRGKVLIFPFGKGSTTGSAWFLETIRRGNGPSAVINVETESIIASAIVMARLLYGITIPLVDRLEEDISEMVTKETIIQVNGDTGEIRMVSGYSPNTTQYCLQDWTRKVAR